MMRWRIFFFSLALGTIIAVLSNDLLLLTLSSLVPSANLHPNLATQISWIGSIAVFVALWFTLEAIWISIKNRVRPKADEENPMTGRLLLFSRMWLSFIVIHLTWLPLFASIAKQTNSGTGDT